MILLQCVLGLDSTAVFEFLFHNVTFAGITGYEHQKVSSYSRFFLYLIVNTDHCESQSCQHQQKSLGCPSSTDLHGAANRSHVKILVVQDLHIERFRLDLAVADINQDVLRSIGFFDFVA